MKDGEKVGHRRRIRERGERKNEGLERMVQISERQQLTQMQKCGYLLIILNNYSEVFHTCFQQKREKVKKRKIWKRNKRKK